MSRNSRWSLLSSARSTSSCSAIWCVVSVLLVGRVGGEAVTRHLFKSNGGLRLRLQSALRASNRIVASYVRSERISFGTQKMGENRTAVSGVNNSENQKFLLTLPQITNTSLPILPHRGANPDRQRRGAGCGGRGSGRRETGWRGGFACGSVSDITAG